MENNFSKKSINEPIFFKSNRVRRIYTGGKLFSSFFGDSSADGYFPEEWVCSSTKALNEGSTDPKEGVSLTESGDYFDDLLENQKEQLIGDRDELGILVKILDSSIRLPIQAHPDVPFSQAHFNSNHGKAESWVILETREDACIYFGFKEEISKEDFDKALLGGEKAFLPLLRRIPVNPGDVFFIPAKAVHAIGAGCLLLETQEPTDFTIQPEEKCGDYTLSENEMYIGLSREDALECFDMTIAGEKAEKASRRTPKIIDGVQHLITEEDTPFFSVNRYFLDNSASAPLTGPAVYVITEGEGELYYDAYHRFLKKGDYFFMPYSANGRFKLRSEKKMQAIVCLPPKK